MPRIAFSQSFLHVKRLSTSAAGAMRLGSLHGLSTLYGALGDAALPHVAEALPIVSELMEDSDAEVRQAALKLMNRLEGLGEMDF